MNDLERRLSDLLHTGAPEPERLITASEIAELAQDGRAPNGRRFQRWGVPLLAAVSVLAAVAVPVLVSRHTAGPTTPSSPSLSTSTSPTTTSTTSPTSPTSATTGVTSCLTNQLSLTPGQRGGTAGSIYATFYLTNTAGTTCTMRGFPGVSLLDDAGKMVGQPATRDGSEGPSVRLGQGQRAQFIVRLGTATRTGCDVPKASSQVQVYPPDQTAPLRIPYAATACAVSVQSLRTG